MKKAGWEKSQCPCGASRYVVRIEGRSGLRCKECGWIFWIEKRPAIWDKGD